MFQSIPCIPKNKFIYRCKSDQSGIILKVNDNYVIYEQHWEYSSTTSADFAQSQTPSRNPQNQHSLPLYTKEQNFQNQEQIKDFQNRVSGV